MGAPLEAFKAKLGVGQPTLKGVGYDYTPTIMQQGQTTDQIGQAVLDKLGQRKQAGADIYSTGRQEGANRLASDLVTKSAGLKFDEFGKPQLNLADFSSPLKDRLTGIGQTGDLATQTADAKAAYRNAVKMQDLGSYGMTGSFSVSPSTAIPGASSDNVGAQAAAAAIKVAQNHTAYVWGGNSLTNGIDCSGLVQQIYKRLGISVPRVTYDQARSGKQVSVKQIRPGDLVFYRPGSRGPEHVGIYVGNGKVVHAANPKLGVITSNLTNSNGAPMLILRPY